MFVGYDWSVLQGNAQIVSQNNWRLLITKTTNGPMNMAVDHAIMEAVAEGRVPPTLRFYAWEPPCLSLGYTQPASDIDQQRLNANGWQLVRRLTGGRAILHTDELTYSVAVQADNPIVAGDIVESYRRLSRALLDCLHTLGADVESEKRAADQPHTKGPVCFEVPSHYEITANNKKLVGSAQVRKMGVVLQHGSLPLTGDITRICDALVFPDEDQREHVRERVQRRAATLEEILNRSISWNEAADTLANSFHEVFDLALVEDNLTPDELRRANELCVEQYSSDTWNKRF
jgi:lipoate-protein ligase A